jgi:hypothetical protein
LLSSLHSTPLSPYRTVDSPVFLLLSPLHSAVTLPYCTQIQSLSNRISVSLSMCPICNLVLPSALTVRYDAVG